ncbi:TPA: fimbria/pilus outer membrane usher protein [Escherichia coli]|nr:fimbria/pilus outer membrane usher protein [Escherichia coli]
MAVNVAKYKCSIVNHIPYVLMFSLSSAPVYSVDFNTDVLDAVDKENIDISRFSHLGYIVPGRYVLDIQVNGQRISSENYSLDFLEMPFSNMNEKQPLPQACLTPEIVSKMGLTEASHRKVTYRHGGLCADFHQLPGVDIRPNIAEGVLNINMPQLWLEYSDESWLPPSQWDNGILGFLFDYNLNGQINKQHRGEKSQSLSYNGTAGVNYEAWRLRGDYQGGITSHNGNMTGSNSQLSWSRFYMYRAIPAWQSNLTLGENYINSDIFNSWHYLGISLESDERMLPPQLRGYAPQVSGVADTNARVVISQKGRIIYDSTVPAGPFSIQELDSSVRGRLDVEVIEQDGRKKTFQLDTAYVPYLTRPGQIRYKIISGRSRSNEHSTEGPFFTTGEASWGINNKWSLYGGSVLAGGYNSFAVGLGRDLSELGTLSADVTQSMARLDDNIKQGNSWRLSYSKRFDDVNADITFAGYRFSDENYLTMEQYLNTRYRNDLTGREKELYTISFNKNFEDWNTSVNLQYNYQNSWDGKISNYYFASVNRYFDVVDLKNISLGVSASRSKYNNRDNDSAFLRLSIPWGSGTVSYNSSINNDRYTNTLGYSRSLSNGLSSYSLNAGMNSGGGLPSQSQLGAYYQHSYSFADLSVNFTTVQNNYSSFGFSASGGLTITEPGIALHAGGMNGSTRLLVDTDGIGGVPIDGGRVFTNYWGIGVVTNVNSYYRNTTSVDLNKLPQDMEATRSVVESVLTEGAIGYRKFDILQGNRLFAVLRLADSKYPPFGANVTNSKGRELGMVADSGLAWLSGVTPGERLNVNWGGKTQCFVDIPERLTSDQQILLLCTKHSN